MKLEQKLQNLVPDVQYYEDETSVYEDVEKETGIPAKIISAMAGVESGHKIDSKNPASSAVGLFQFIEPTRNAYADRLAKDGKYVDLSNPTDLYTQSKLMSEYIKDNVQAAKKAKGTDYMPSAADLYMLHHLGVGTGKSLLKADDKADIRSVIPKHILDSHPGIYEGVNTKEELIQKIGDKLKGNVHKKYQEQQVQPPMLPEEQMLDEYSKLKNKDTNLSAKVRKMDSGLA